MKKRKPNGKMYAKYQLLEALKKGVVDRKDNVVNNIRQQVYFLQKDGHQIINTGNGKYKLL